MTETAWLIEQDSPARGPVWFSAVGPEWRFVNDANEALRFARKTDAETFIKWLGGNPLLSNPRATEHQWLDAARAEGRRSPGGGGERFWLILKEPGRQPELKGSWLLTSMAATLREFIAARPTAYIDVLTWGEGGPIVEHGPQALQVLDGRSMATGRKHNERTREAHAPHHAALSSPPPSGEVREAVADLIATKLRRYTMFSEDTNILDAIAHFRREKDVGKAIETVRDVASWIAEDVLALIPRRDEAALPEAVAWRWRLFHPNSASGPIWGPWYVGPSKPEFRADIRSEVEPLYAAPPPPPVAELPGDVETLVTALNGLRAEWHRQAEAYEKDSKKSEPATNREMARSYSALLDRVASDLKLTITCATQGSRAPTDTGEGR